jgi:hypothetical protein
MQNEKVVTDLVIRLGHDGLKARRMPNMDEILEDLVTSAGHYYVLENPMKMVENLVPGVDVNIKKELSRFVSQSLIAWGYKYLMKKPVNPADVMMKQLLVQGSEMVWNQLK